MLKASNKWDLLITRTMADGKITHEINGMVNKCKKPDVQSITNKWLIIVGLN